MQDQPLLSVQQLRKSFGNLIAVNDVSFTINRGEVPLPATWLLILTGLAGIAGQLGGARFSCPRGASATDGNHAGG
jgi:hypothetical protein